VDAPLIHFLAGLEDIARAELDAEVTRLASLIDYENVGVA
jgi:hypothetical protein